MVPLLKGEIKHSWGFHKRRERLDENESLRITNTKFETREGSVKEELERLRTSKKGESQLWEGEQRQKGHSQKNCQSIKQGGG